MNDCVNEELRSEHACRIKLRNKTRMNIGKQAMLLFVGPVLSLFGLDKDNGFLVSLAGNLDLAWGF